MELLDRQVAIVTGGAQGIGLGIATVLRAEGANIVIADIDGAAAAQSASRLSGTGEHAIGVRADVTAQADVDNVAAEAVGRWGRIDILAANAGIYPHIPLSDIGVADWNRVMAINVGCTRSRSGWNHGQRGAARQHQNAWLRRSRSRARATDAGRDSGE